MDLPVFHLDWLNNRMLIAVVAILHVIINHGLAVGGIPLVAFLEWQGHKRDVASREQLAHNLIFIFFVLTTTVGAMTGVGIWFTTALVNPYAIGSLLRVFFWTWFVEWIVFVTEVALILTYYLTWRKWSVAAKQKHVKLGVALAVASWLTMALIVSILGFMMDPGSWLSDRTLFSGMLNPTYLPQLAFRTPLALWMAGCFGLAILGLSPKSSKMRNDDSFQILSKWTMFWTLPTTAGGLYYAFSIPEAHRPNIAVALLTQALARWAEQAQLAALLVPVVVFGLLLLTRWRRARTPRLVLLVPAVLACTLLGYFERVREFVRKPYTISGYMYANGVRADDLALYQRDGILAHTSYAVDPDSHTPVERGRAVFRLTCSRCHTIDNMNGVRPALQTMYGADAVWEKTAIESFVSSMHQMRPYMPPFPGSKAEISDLASYLVHLQHHPESLRGAQSIGLDIYKND